MGILISMFSHLQWFLKMKLEMEFFAEWYQAAEL